MDELISRADAIDGLDGHRVERINLNDWQEGWNAALDWVQGYYLEDLPSAEKTQLSGEDTTKDATSDFISRQAAIDALDEYFVRIGKLKRRGLNKGEKAISLDTVGVIKTLPSAQPEDWMERNKERILQAGMEGQEIEFRIGGRLFAIREKAQ